jgi:hypothetical protein
VTVSLKELRKRRDELNIKIAALAKVERSKKSRRQSAKERAKEKVYKELYGDVAVVQHFVEDDELRGHHKGLYYRQRYPKGWHPCSMYFSYSSFGQLHVSRCGHGGSIAAHGVHFCRMHIDDAHLTVRRLNWKGNSIWE